MPMMLLGRHSKIASSTLIAEEGSLDSAKGIPLVVGAAAESFRLSDPEGTALSAKIGITNEGGADDAGPLIDVGSTEMVGFLFVGNCVNDGTSACEG